MDSLDMLEKSESIVSGTNISALPNPAGFSKTPRRMCCHSLDPFTLDNGQTVYLSAVFDARMYRDWIPDIGIYFDGSWDRESESFTYLVPWEDYGLPLVTMSVFDRYIRTALEHINNSETVDIGCMGGHGRTGTFLACLDIAASDGAMTVRKAIKKVRRDHCFSAIETREQEWFIACYRAYYRGEDMPPKPKHEPKTGVSNGKAIYSADTKPTPIGSNLAPTAYGNHYESDYVWNDKKECVAYTNPTTGTRWELIDNRWSIVDNYVPTLIEKD
jgi:hypothetical protein